MELWTFVMECNREGHSHDLSGLGLSSVLSFGHVKSGYCTIKTTVGAGTHLSMNLPLDTKSIVLNEPALLVIVIYGASKLWRRAQVRESMAGEWLRATVFQFGWSIKIRHQTGHQIVFRLAQTILTMGRKTQ